MSVDHEISRRDFLKLSAGVIGTVALYPLLEKVSSEILPINRTETESANKISFRKDRIIDVNSESVFPIGLYFLPSPGSLESWKKMSSAGLNIVNQWPMGENSIGEAEKNDVYFMTYLPNMPGITRTREVYLQTLNRLKKSKSNLGYYAPDEPAIDCAKILYMKALGQIQQLDPDHAVLTDFYERPQATEGLLDFGSYKKSYKGDPSDLNDLSGPVTVDEFQNWFLKKSHTEIVSYGYGYTGDVNDNVDYADITDEYMTRLKNGDFGQSVKAVWVTLSAHSEIPRTLKSMRFQAVEVMAHGATGILWWDWPPGCEAEDCPGYPGKGNGYSTHWEKIQYIGRELTGVKKGLIGEELILGKNQSGNVAYKLTKSDEGKCYVFAASNFKDPREPSKEKIHISLPNKSFLVSGENRVVISDRNGYLEDNYGYLDARIYTQLGDIY